MPVCKKGRYAPPVHMIKLTMEREITAYIWVHPDDDEGDISNEPTVS